MGGPRSPASAQMGLWFRGCSLGMQAALFLLAIFPSSLPGLQRGSRRHVESRPPHRGLLTADPGAGPGPPCSRVPDTQRICAIDAVLGAPWLLLGF